MMPDNRHDNQLRREAIQRLHGERRPLAEMATEDVETLIHELEVHQIELEVQNEELRCIQNQLVEARDRYIDLYEFAPVGYLTVDEKGTIRRANLAVVDLCARERGQILGRRLEQIAALEDRDACYLLLRNASASQQAQTAELRLDRSDQKELWVSVKVKAYPAGGGTPPEYRVTLTDITRRKQIERERLELERQLHHTQKMESLGVLAGGIAHDFNNILMAILGNAELIMAELDQRIALRQPLEDILNATLRGKELTGLMLAYAGKGPFQFSNLNLGQAVKGMLPLLRSNLAGKIRLELGPDGPMPPIWADRGQLEQIILNLVANALESIDPASGGSVSVKTGRMRVGTESIPGSHGELPPGEYVFLRVSDTGCGMDEETLAKIFEPFFTTKFQGRGLGLAALHGILQRHHGHIAIQSTPRKGTTVTVLFPPSTHQGEEDRSPEPMQPSSDDAASPEITKTEPEGEIQEMPDLVVLADDEEPLRRLGQRMIERFGFSVRAAENGLEAMRLYETHRDNIVCMVLDLTMPEKDGVEVTREILATDPQMPIILCSGYAEKEVRPPELDRDSVTFLQKPFQLDRLQTALNAAQASRTSP